MNRQINRSGLWGGWLWGASGHIGVIIGHGEDNGECTLVTGSLGPSTVINQPRSSRDLSQSLVTRGPPPLQGQPDASGGGLWKVNITVYL